MVLSTPATRRMLHTRRVEYVGYAREDGLYDIEASLIDTKGFGHQARHRGWVEAGAPIHHFKLRLTVDEQRLVHAVEVITAVAPYADCFTVPPDLQALVGKSVARGWKRMLTDLFGGADGCTHIREMLVGIATVVQQSIDGGQRGINRALNDDNAAKPFQINGCRAWSERGALVKELFPKWYMKPVD